MLVSLVLAAIAVTLYYWLLLPRLRRLPWWDAAAAEVRAVLARAGARLRGLCGNSKTIAVAYAAEFSACSTRPRCSTGRSFSAPTAPAASW